MPSQFCAEPGCGARVSSGRCPAHTPQFRRTRPAYPGEQWYDSAAWRRLRWEVLRVDPFCRVCRAAGCLTVATEIDHIERHYGDPRRFWDRANLQPLCKRHHSAKTLRETKDATR